MGDRSGSIFLKARRVAGLGGWALRFGRRFGLAATFGAPMSGAVFDEIAKLAAEEADACVFRRIWRAGSLLRTHLDGR